MAIKNYTPSDITLAKAYFKILVETAIKRETITYGDLVTESKRRYPDDKEIAGDLARHAGRRLEVLRDHTSLYDLTDISCLAVSAGTQEAGDAYHLKEQAESLRLAAYETEWLDYYSSVISALDTTRAEWVNDN